MEEFYEAGATITHTQLKNEWMDVKYAAQLMDLCERVNQLGCDGDITEMEMKSLMDQLMYFHNFYKEDEDNLEEDDEELEDIMRDGIYSHLWDILYDIEVLSRGELLDAYKCTSRSGRDVWMRDYGHKVECPPHLWQDSPLSQEIIEEMYNDVLWKIFTDDHPSITHILAQRA